MNIRVNNGEERARILVVDEEADILDILRLNLESEGYIVDAVSSGKEALEKLTPKHRLIILDVVISDMSGYHVAERLRREDIRTPIIFLTARNTENDILTGFSVGADDYIFKPFSINEVIARVKAITWRDYETFPSENKRKNTVSFRRVVLNCNSKTLEVNGQNVFITRKEFELLLLLIKEQGKLLTREDILERVWRSETCVLGRTVDVHIARIRGKIGEYGVCLICRVGYGYLFDPLAID
ncbi:MAG: response regulator transcription factor [Dysgonamonadaceae bacterium]|jgi:two-component system alkaline phosphatase synthesis response regulator PhoP|nr:response regulator transcription factor [Dysgonamonadaceae bacterium]